jgi:hypothetical protein
VRRWVLAGIVLVIAVAQVPAASAAPARHCPQVVVPANPARISYDIRVFALECNEARAIVRQYMLTRLRSGRCRFRADNPPYIGCQVQHGFSCELAGIRNQISSPEECLRAGRNGASIFFRSKRAAT